MHLSDLPNRIRKLMSVIDPADEMLLHILKTEAERFEAAIRQGGDIRYACEQETLAEARRVEIESLKAKVAELQQTNMELRARIDEVRRQMAHRLTDAEKIISDIAEAAECDNFADIIIARVASLAQQANAMTRICEGHIATCRKAEAANLRLNGELAKAQHERDELKNQDNQKRAMLHRIADELGAGSRNALPALDWYLKKIENINHEANNRSAASSANHREYLNTIGEAVGKPGLSYKDLADYVRGLDVAALQAKAADAEKVKADAGTRIRELETTVGIAICRENDAKAACEASHATLGRLAAALGVDPGESGWHTKMLAKATSLVYQVNSKEYKWDKRQTDALQSLLQAHGFWPAYNNVEGLNKFKDFVKGLGAKIQRLEDEIQRYEAAKKEWDRDLADAQKGATAARDELALAGVAIKRMHAKLLDNKLWTGIWPDDGVFRAKLDDIEWCLNVYIGRYLEALSKREADTKFIASVRDSLSHEILRRNKQ